MQKRQTHNNKNKNEEEDEVVISIKELYKSFDGNNVLQGIDLELHKGENIVVLGRSGSGKSVLIRIITRLLKPDKGVIKVFGKEIDKLNKKELIKLRLKIGFLFQHNALYDSMTVRENIEFPLIRNERDISERDINEAVDEILDAVGLADIGDHLTSELSGGEQKRIGIARTLILRPEIILYDEPTSGLDPLTCVEINNLINELQKKYKTSSIIITHDLTCAKTTGDKIFMLIDGKFIRQGDFEEVFETDDKRIRGFFDYNFTQ